MTRPRRGNGPVQHDEPGSRLYVGNIPYDALEEDVRALFDGHRVVGVFVPVDRDTGAGRGFAFVSFVSADDADKARVALAGAQVGGRTVRLSVAEARR